MRKSFSIACLLVTAAMGSQTMAADLPPKYGDTSLDGQWVYIGGDSGWDPAPHRYVRRGGQWVHEDALVHDSTRPAWLTLADRERQIPRPGGATHRLERRDGQWVHVDSLPHDAPRPAIRPSADRAWDYIPGD